MANFSRTQQQKFKDFMDHLVTIHGKNIFKIP